MTSATLAYRDPLEGTRIRYVELLASRSGFPDISRTYAARTGRIAAGAVGITGAALLVLAALTNLGGTRIPLTPILMLSWPVMMGAYGIGWIRGARRARRGAPAATGDLQTDLARLEAAPSTDVSRDLAVKLERSSTALPMIAVALLAPLTIHAFVAAIMGVDTAGYDSWINMSLVLVGHAHVALAWRCSQFAADACLIGADHLELTYSGAYWRALGTAILVSTVPGALLLALPPIITAATGVLFIPLLFWGMTRILIAERRVLA